MPDEAGLSIRAVQWLGDRLRILDQARLPHRLVYRELRDAEGVAQAIRGLRVRGAPLIGIAAAYGVVLGARGLPVSSLPQFTKGLEGEARALEREEEEAGEKMGQHGAELLADGDLVITHCNSGSLATAGVGTALGVIKMAHRQ